MNENKNIESIDLVEYDDGHGNRGLLPVFKGIVYDYEVFVNKTNNKLAIRFDERDVPFKTRTYYLEKFPLVDEGKIEIMEVEDNKIFTSYSTSGPSIILRLSASEEGTVRADYIRMENRTISRAEEMAKRSSRPIILRREDDKEKNKCEYKKLIELATTKLINLEYRIVEEFKGFNIVNPILDTYSNIFLILHKIDSYYSYEVWLGNVKDSTYFNGTCLYRSDIKYENLASALHENIKFEDNILYIGDSDKLFISLISFTVYEEKLFIVNDRNNFFTVYLIYNKLLKEKILSSDIDSKIEYERIYINDRITFFPSRLKYIKSVPDWVRIVIQINKSSNGTDITFSMFMFAFEPDAWVASEWYSGGTTLTELLNSELRTLNSSLLLNFGLLRYRFQFKEEDGNKKIEYSKNI